MNIERTMQFILESQARAEIRAEKAEMRMEKADIRMEKAEIRADAMEKRLDKRLDAIARLLQQGMRMLVKTDTNLAAVAAGQKRTGQKLEELAEAQKATDRSLKAFIDGLRDGRNGH